MKNDNNSAIDKDDDYEFCSLHEPFYLSHTFYNGRQQVIGKMDARYGGMWWTPATGETSYCLAPTELDAIIRAHCASPDKQVERRSNFREYAPLLPCRSLPDTELTEIQLEKLRALNARLMDMEVQLVREVQPQVDALQARVDDLEDWLQDFECRILLRFSVGTDDPDYDEEDSENVLLTRKHSYSTIHDHYNDRVVDGINWNMYERLDCDWHPMHKEVHCWLYHDLYDHADIGWANLLRIDEVWIDVKFWQQRWEKGLCKP
jgi:hypothetical protein